MSKTVLNVKTDIDVKRDAQMLAKKIGVPLSTIVNAQLKRFILDGKVEFSAYAQPSLTLGDIKAKATPIFKKYGISRASVFGSYARGEATPDSDIDLLISYGKPLGVWDVMGLRDELTEELAREIDLVSEKAVIPHFRESIYKDLQPLYEG